MKKSMKIKLGRETLYALSTETAIVVQGASAGASCGCSNNCKTNTATCELT